MYEHRSEPLLSTRAFRRRMARHGLHALWLLLGSLAGGTLGFWKLADQPPIDALLNAAMLLGGMGPVGEIHGTTGKLFATVFALYAGLAFIGLAALVLAPVFHRILHRFHLEEHHQREPRRPDGRSRPTI